MAGAVAQVKAHLGPNALILNTRTLRKGGLFSRSRGQLVEITAAEDANTSPSEFHASKSSPHSQQPHSPQLKTTNRVSLPAADVPAWLEQDQATPDKIASLANDRLRLNLSARPVQTPAAAPLPDEISALFESFLAQHIAESLANELLRDLPSRLDLASEPDANPLLSRMEKLIPTSGPIQPGLPGKPQIVSFVGPTGVGKTTTIAKLAAQYKLQRNISVALLTIDTYRIAAVDQLRTYADIIDVPFSAVLTAKELSQQIARLADHSLIFIDTTGRSPNDHLRLAELRSFQQALGNHQTQLVMAATTAYPQMISAIEKFSTLGIDQVLLTKLDEVVSLSPVLNVFASLASGRTDASPIPISYITAGQDVPDDIEIASSRNLAARILQEHCD